MFLIKKIQTLKRGISNDLRKKVAEQYKTLKEYADRLQKNKIKIKELENQYNTLNLQYEALIRASNPYASITPINEDMQKKWENSPGKRILFLTPKDYSGSFMKWAQALHRYSPYAVRLVTFTSHQFGYPTDIVFPVTDKSFWNRLIPLLEEADVIHLKDEHYFFAANYGMKKIYGQDSTRKMPLFSRFLKYLLMHENVANKPKVFTHYGGYARKYKFDSDYQQFVNNEFAARITMTPDLNFDWFKGHFIPHAIDADQFKYTWQDGNVIAHSPSTAERKGTDEFLRAIERTRELQNWNLDLIQGVSHKECIQRKQKSTLFFDQAGRERDKVLGVSDVIGFYGNSALEAMVHGIPTIAHISEQALDGAKRAGKDWSICPVINPKPNDVKSMQDVIAGFINLSLEEKIVLSKKTRDWIETHHSFQSTAKELAEVYDSLIKEKSKAAVSEENKVLV